MTPRLAALNVLLAIENGHTTLAAELDRARAALGDERDRALLVELTAGTLRWRAELDALIAQCSARPPGDLTPAVRGILRMTTYQLVHLDRIPEHAALHEAVEMTRSAGEPRAAGFVNAVLRTFLRTRTRLSLPDATQDLEYLSTTLSHPRWLVERWVARHGFEAAERWCQFNNQTPEITVRSLGRVNARDLLGRLRDAGVEAEPGRFVADAITLAPGMLGHVPAELADELLPQDEASQLVAHAVGAMPGHRVLDLCAAPGAKTLVLWADLRQQGLLTACDFRASRVRLLGRMLRRAQVPAHVVRLDASQPLPFAPVFDRVFVDAPCSGLGIIRRDPDLKWIRQPADLPAFAIVQQRMLAQAAEAVRPGGRLVYATCSSEPEENEAVARAFEADNPRFTARPIAVEPAASAAGLVDERGWLRTLPFRDRLDAFFAAAFERS